MVNYLYPMMYRNMPYYPFYPCFSISQTGSFTPQYLANYAGFPYAQYLHFGWSPRGYSYPWIIRGYRIRRGRGRGRGFRWL